MKCLLKAEAALFAANLEFILYTLRKNTVQDGWNKDNSDRKEHCLVLYES